MSGHSARTTGRTMQKIPMAVFMVFLFGGVSIFLIVRFFLLADGVHHGGAHSEGVDVPVCSEGDGDGGEDAEGCECHFKKFHFIGGRFFDCWPSGLSFF